MTFEQLSEIIRSRKEKMPADSYVATLFRSGIDRVAQKVGEEGVEVVIAAKNKEKDRQVSELTDLFFHTLILMAQLGITLEDIETELENRKKTSPVPNQ